MPGADQRTLIATGFLALGARVLAEQDREKLVFDTIDEQIDTLGKVFMGLSLGCARCHDHKFDPISQADYYALAAIFKGTKSFADSRTGAIWHWYEHSFAGEDQRERIAKIDAEIAQKKKTAADFKNAASNAFAMRRVHAPLTTSSPVRSSTCVPRYPRLLGSPTKRDCIRVSCIRRGGTIQFRSDDPVLQTWHAWRRSPDRVREYYQSLFAAATAPDDAATVALQPSGETWDEELVRQARALLDDPTGLLGVRAKPEHAFDPDTLSQYYDLLDIARIAESAAPDIPAAMGVAGR